MPNRQPAWRVIPLIVLMLGAASIAAGPGEGAPAHPEVDQAVECQVCHAEVTPKVVKEWDASPHGKFNVKCFVCHGSIGADFTHGPLNQSRH